MTRQYNNLLQIQENQKTQNFYWDRDATFLKEGTKTQVYLQDDLGSPIRLLEPTRTTMEFYGYDEFGQDMYGNQGKVQPFGYTGYQFDSIADTYFAQAREYLPQAGRFMGLDVIMGNLVKPLTLNEYAYCWNQPMSLVDLDGMKPHPKTMAKMAKGAGEPLDDLKSFAVRTIGGMVSRLPSSMQMAINEVRMDYSALKHSKHTVIRGIDVSGNIGNLSGAASIGVVIDPKGNILIQGAAGGGGTVATSPGGALNTFRVVMDTNNANKLGDTSFQVGAGGVLPCVIPIFIGGEWVTDNMGNQGLLRLLGIGTSPGFDIHLQIMKSKTFFSFNIFSIE